MTEAQKTSLDLGSMMDSALDSIPDAPDFNNPPAGDYRISVKDSKIETYKTKEKNGQPSVEAQRIKNLYVVEQTVSLANSNEPPVPDGSMFSETFQGTEQGLSYFKKRAKEIMNVSDLNGVPLRDIFESLKGQSFDARISIKKTPNPNDKDNPYENLVIKIVPPAAS